MDVRVVHPGREKTESRKKDPITMADMMKTMELQDLWAEAAEEDGRPVSDDTFLISCPSCATRYRIPRLKVDSPRKVRCLHCSGRFIVSVSNPS